ncbi:hypothetical protein P8H27_02060 [Pseudomonas sp. sp1636]|uniref:hypothetical protein n=1 Tax=Pseudomonas sp. sp1636 TaxID=3036707 RepID=UPI0025A55FAD|nr:hypothetical protein [Pseudomonas sp. sp1636]MDM8347682.1 hypothetical protein [Pseudomonas sp. sp1636]
MSKYSYFNLIKSKAKTLAQEQGFKLSVAQEQLATSLKFKDFHELTTVASRNPDDARLIGAALGSSNTADVIYDSPVYERFCEEIDNLLSGETADTNAYDYSCEDFEVTASSYDETKGLLALEVSFTYSGEQDQDRPYAGCEFYLDVEVTLARRSGEWLFEEDWVVLTKIETDQDRDREAELEDMYADYLKDKKRTDGM